MVIVIGLAARERPNILRAVSGHKSRDRLFRPETGNSFPHPVIVWREVVIPSAIKSAYVH